MIDSADINIARNHFRLVCNAEPCRFLYVCISQQRLYVIEDSIATREFPVSTSRFGVGNREDSLMTPSGVHRVKEKYGAGAPLGRVFRDRLDTGEDWPIGTPGENLILTRILRLEGCEIGINKGNGIDSYDRYIYIHGTNNERLIGQPASHGCVCMTNADIVELFDTIPEGTLVYIA
jgi:lipoprotein-anchoring transpeptidase ErfK/SrfK